MTPPLTFTCTHCRKPIGVALEHAGKAVGCPHCRQVVQAPLAPVPVPAVVAGVHVNGYLPNPPAADQPEESIFGEVIEEGDSEAVFGFTAERKVPTVDMPETTAPARNATPLHLSPPTQRVPGLPPPPEMPRPQVGTVKKIPLQEEDAQSFTASADAFASVSGGVANPFQMEAALPTEFSESESAPSRSNRKKKDVGTEGGPDWKLWILVGLGAYSFLMTIVAVWGWTRSPSAPPAKVDTHSPATQKAKTR